MTKKLLVVDSWATSDTVRRNMPQEWDVCVPGAALAGGRYSHIVVVARPAEGHETEFRNWVERQLRIRLAAGGVLI